MIGYIQNGAPKLLLMAQPLKHPQSESVPIRPNVSFAARRRALGPEQAASWVTAILVILSISRIAVVRLGRLLWSHYKVWLNAHRRRNRGVGAGPPDFFV